MATIVWVNPQGQTVRSHTLDPAGTKREIEERFGGHIVEVEQPREATPKVTYHRDPSSGRVTHLTKESTVIEEAPAPAPTPVVEPEEKKEASKHVSDPFYGGPPYTIYKSQRYKDLQPVFSPAPPGSEPGMYERPGTTATPEQLATLPPPRKGIIPVGLPKSETQTREEQAVSIGRAKREAGERIEEERIGFEETYQPQAQDVVQSHYDSLMGEKARSLGMVLNPATGTWMYTDTNQLEKFYAYQPIAQQLAIEQGTSFYEKQWEQYGMGERAESIYREEYGEEGFKLVEKDDGTFDVVTKKEYERQLAVDVERERIRERMKGTPEERIIEFARFVSLSVLKPGMLFEVGRQAIVETPEEALETYASKTEELIGKGIPDVFVSSYTDPSGLGFYSLIYAGFQLMGTGLGAIPGAGGQILQKGVPVAIMGGVSTVVGADIGITAAMESPFKPEEGFKPEELFLKGESGRKTVMYGTALAYLMGLGYAGTRPYTLLEPKYKPVHGILETPIGKKFEVVGVKKYGEVFGREVFGKYRFVAGREYQYPLGGYKPPLAISKGKVPYRTGEPTTAELSKAVVSLTQIKGVQKITFDVAKGTFVTERIIPKKTLPLDFKFKPPKEIVKTPEEILFTTKLDIDLFKKAEKTLVQKKITDVEKGKFVIGDVTLKLEKTIDLTGIKPIGKPIKPIPKTVRDFSKWEVTEADEKRFLRERELAEAKLRTFRTQKVVGLKDIFKQPLIQKRLFDEFRVITREGKPIVRKLIPEPKKIVDIEAIVKPKPLVETMQTTLDKLFKLPSFELVKGVITKVPPSKPFRYKPIKEEKIIESQTDKTVTLLKKIDVKTTVRELDFKVFDEKTFAVSKETLRKLGRFGTDEYTRMKHPEAPKGIVKPTDRLDLFVTPITGRISKTEISQSKVVGELSGRLTQIGRVNIFESAMSKLIDVQQRNELKMSQGILQESLSIQDVISGERQTQIQTQTQLQMQRQALRTELVLVSETKTIPEKPTVTVTPPAILGFEKGLMKGVSLTPQAYDVFVYKTQFKDGRRIRGKEEVKLNKKPLRRMDALALGSDLVDNTAKRTIILKKVEGKPTKLKKKVRGWASQMFEYNDKGNDVYVEKNTHAIDSPGEIREITLKGISARKRGGKRSKSGLPGGIRSLESRISRRMII